MIINDGTKERTLAQVKENIDELISFEVSYNQKIKLYFNASKNINELILNSGDIQEIDYYYFLNDKIIDSLKSFQNQLQKIDKTLISLIKIQKDLDEFELKKFKNRFKQYNENYNIIKNNYINNSVYEENIMLEYACIPWKNINYNLQESLNENNKIEDNDTLLISEIQNKVLLPYTGQEVKEILNDENNDYKIEQEVIDDVFTKTLDEYKASFSARFREAYELATKRDKFSKLDGIQLGLELFGQRYLHPAIIAACRNTDELDVYLDCLSKNELDDFKIFDIKYELYPMVVNKKEDLEGKVNFLLKIWNYFKKFFVRKKHEQKEKNI